jgi:hypothetical protein
MWQLSGQKEGCYLIDNGGGIGDLPSIYDGFLDREKHDMVSNGLSRLETSITDVSAILSAGPIYLAPGDKSRVIQAIAYSNGDKDKHELKQEISSFLKENADLIYGSTEGDQSPVLNIFPNPIVDESMLVLEMRDNAALTLRIYDTSGKLVHSMIKSEFHGLGKYIFSLPSLPAGSYNLLAETPSSRVSTILIYE